MSWIKDIEYFDYTKKSFFIGVPALTCFWYLAIYIGNTDFLPRTEYFVSFVFAFCLAFVWYFANLIYLNLSFRCMEIKELKKGEPVKENPDQGIKTLTVLITSSGILSIFVLLAYLLSLRFLFVAIAPFIVILILIVIRLIQFAVIKKK